MRYLYLFLLFFFNLFSCQISEQNQILQDPLLKKVHEKGHLFIQPLTFTHSEKQDLLETLEEHNQRFNPEENLLKSEFSSPGYHTTLTGGEVHKTRQNMRYAVSLLDSHEELFRIRAIKVLDRVIGLQETDPDHEYFGIWPWFLEEPIDKMAPPDRNWADFCGAQLLEITLTHRHRLPDSLNQKIDQSLQYAAKSIQKRDVGPGYTNIAIMGTFVTYVTSELFELSQMNQYARQRMIRFYEFTKHHQGFTEYNSPTYTRVALDELSRMRKYILDPELKPMIEELYYMGWKIFADHFHAPTRQLAGPHSRCYETVDGARFWDFIQNASLGAIKWGEYPPRNFQKRLVHEMPNDLITHFQQLNQPRLQRSIFYNDKPRKIGVTYLHPKYTIVTISRSNFWNQRRNLLAYWGGPDDVKYLNLRFYHDGYDFSAVQFYSVQKENQVIAAANFATDGGDTHISLDRIENASFTAEELKLRFELGDVKLENFSLPAKYNDPIAFHVDDLHFQIYTPYVALGDFVPYWEITHAGRDTMLDLVVYQGNRKKFDLNKIQKVVVGIFFSMSEAVSEKSIEETVSYRIINDGFYLQQSDMVIGIPINPATESKLQQVQSNENSLIHASLMKKAF